MNAAARVSLALLCWAAAGLAGWWLQRPPPLASTSAPLAAAAAAASGAASAASPQAMAGRIARADPMGLARAAPPAGLPAVPGAPVAPGAAPAAGELNWRLAALVVRERERYAVLTAPEQKPLQVRPGELLPDGDRLVRIDARSIEVRSPRGRLRTLTLTEP
ncbi:MAG: hypothetical protein IT480_05190 [Gammaproteobacteria bacterium]|nr:hypothetical protein [Gammaproteobacteria bacterium]